MDLIDKITQKSKMAKFDAQKEYKHNKSVVPYEELIVLNDKYKDFAFLVHKNMIFEYYSLVDSSYRVFSFDRKGNFVREESPKDLGFEFFRDMKIIKKI
jgi:hypothetical protein